MNILKDTKEDITSEFEGRASDPIDLYLQGINLEEISEHFQRDSLRYSRNILL